MLFMKGEIIMPRPCKRRRICGLPACARFGPKDGSTDARQTVTMTLDEFETIRLIDLEGMTQEQCAGQMSVARTTAQAIYNSARVKLADCVVNQKELHIAGGEYVLCDGNHAGCGRGKCYGHKREGACNHDALMNDEKEKHT